MIPRRNRKHRNGRLFILPEHRAEPETEYPRATQTNLVVPTREQWEQRAASLRPAQKAA